MTLAGWKEMGLWWSVSHVPQNVKNLDLPNHALKLLLTNVWRYFAIHHARFERHGERLCHILLYRYWDGRILVRSSNPKLCRT